jgi:hypothetical protein
LLGLLAVGLALAGCGEAERTSSSESTAVFMSPAAKATAEVPPPARPEPAKPGEAADKTPPVMPRRIIYNGTVELAVESLPGLEERLRRLAEESGGFIADEDVNSQAHAQPTGTWKIRVPVDRFPDFFKAVGKLGELHRSHVDSQDVSQEYYDLEARITNKQQEEKRLLKHLEDSTGKLEEILTVEREISRVRGEVEQMQGRLRFLANLSALSTVTITATELKDYKPPVIPTFATEIARTFQGSLQLLTDFGKAVVLFLVALAPWLPFILLALWLAWRLSRPWRLGRAPRGA